MQVSITYIQAWKEKQSYIGNGVSGIILMVFEAIWQQEISWWAFLKTC